jgi:hypothetical protein
VRKILIFDKPLSYIVHERIISFPQFPHLPQFLGKIDDEHSVSIWLLDIFIFIFPVFPNFWVKWGRFWYLTYHHHILCTKGKYLSRSFPNLSQFLGKIDDDNYNVSIWILGTLFFIFPIFPNFWVKWGRFCNLTSHHHVLYTKGKYLSRSSPIFPNFWVRLTIRITYLSEY